MDAKNIALPILFSARNRLLSECHGERSRTRLVEGVLLLTGKHFNCSLEKNIDGDFDCTSTALRLRSGQATQCDSRVALPRSFVKPRDGYAVRQCDCILNFYLVMLNWLLNVTLRL